MYIYFPSVEDPGHIYLIMVYKVKIENCPKVLSLHGHHRNIALLLQ
jgi:hypothetical protein